MKAKFLQAIFTVCCTMIAVDSFSQQNASTAQKNEEIIIHKNSSDTGKTIIEIDSNIVTINGKPLSEYNGDVTVSRRRNFMGGADGGNFLTQPQDLMLTDNAAFLGVYSAKTDKGVVINTVLDSSSAKTSGLQKGDIITKVNDKEITSPEDLRNAIQSYKPGDKITIDCLRDGKKKSVKVELGKTPSSVKQYDMQLQKNLMNGFGNGNNYNFRMLPMPPGNFKNFNFNFNDNRPRLGLQIQDTQDSSGVKVQNVLSGSPADKAGIKEGDIITELNGEKVSGVDNIMSEIHNKNYKGDFKIKVLRDKKEMNFDVHIARPLRSTNI
jgi:serine protease Do